MLNFLKKIKLTKSYYFFVVISIYLSANLVLAEEVESSGLAGYFLDALKNFVAWFFTMVQEIAAAIFYFSAMVFDNLLAISLSVDLFNASFIKVL
jgi:hypothetical protein